MKYMKGRGLLKSVTYHSGGAFFSKRVFRGVVEDDSSVSVFRRDYLFIANKNYPWVKVRTCPSMDNFIENCHGWE